MKIDEIYATGKFGDSTGITNCNGPFLFGGVHPNQENNFRNDTKIEKQLQFSGKNLLYFL